MKYKLMLLILLCNQLNGQGLDDSICSLLMYPFIMDRYNYDGYNPDENNGKVHINDSGEMIESNKVRRWLIRYGEGSLLINRHLDFNQLREVYIFHDPEKGIYLDFLTKNRIQILTLHFKNNVRNDLMFAPSFLFENVTRHLNRDLRYLSVFNYGLNMEELYLYKNLQYLNIGGNSDMDFIPLNIGSLSRLKVLVADSSLLNSPEFAVIRSMNPTLKIVPFTQADSLLNGKFEFDDKVLDFHTEFLLKYCSLSESKNKSTLNGPYVLKDSLGRVLFKGNFDNKGRLHGNIQLFDTFGTLLQNRYYNHSKPVKRWTKYNSRKRIICEIKMARYPEYWCYNYNDITGEFIDVIYFKILKKYTKYSICKRVICY